MKILKKERSIKLNLTVWFASFFMAMMLIAIGVLLVAGDSIVKTDNKQKLTNLVTSNLEELEYIERDQLAKEDMDEGDHFIEYENGYVEIDDDFCEYRDGIYVSLYYNNELVYGEIPVMSDEFLYNKAGMRTVKADGEQYYIYEAQVTAEGLDGFWVRGVVNRKEGMTLLLILMRFALISLPAISVIAVIGGFLIVKRQLQPLDEIGEQAQTIVKGSDLQREIAIKHRNTETVMLRDTMNEMLKRLARSFEAEKQFTSDASHELRTPVAVIMAECEYALSTEQTEEWKESLEVIAEQGGRISGLIEELLMFTRMEQKTINIECSPVSLTDIAREVCGEQSAIWDKDITLHENLDDEVIVNADSALLKRMVSNLVENAYKYGRQAGNIWVSAEIKDGRPIFEVKDDGIGIAQDEIPKIWNRFYRCDNARTYENSTGLGLTMVKQIADIFGAEIEVKSGLGEGTVFLVEF